MNAAFMQGHFLRMARIGHVDPECEERGNSPKLADPQVRCSSVAGDFSPRMRVPD